MHLKIEKQSYKGDKQISGKGLINRDEGNIRLMMDNKN